MKYNYTDIQNELIRRSVDATRKGKKSFTITFKESGNIWEIKDCCEWRGTRNGGFRHWVEAINNGNVKHFKNDEKLAKAIAAGFIK